MKKATSEVVTIWTVHVADGGKLKLAFATGIRFARQIKLSQQYAGRSDAFDCRTTLQLTEVVYTPEEAVAKYIDQKRERMVDFRATADECERLANEAALLIPAKAEVSP